MSSMPRTRRERKAATRQRILDAARRCFIEGGFHDTAVGSISRAAEVAHGTFYVHFPSKEAVLDELLDSFNRDFAERIAPVLGAHARLGPMVRSAVEVFLDYWHEHRGFVAAYAERASAGLSPAELRDGINPPMVTALRAALAAVAHQRGGASGDGDWDLATHALLAMWMRVGLQFLFNDDVSRERAVDTLTTMTIGAISAVLPEE
jgi:AcrR family transcriptional regulator